MDKPLADVPIFCNTPAMPFTTSLASLQWHFKNFDWSNGHVTRTKDRTLPTSVLIVLIRLSSSVLRTGMGQNWSATEAYDATRNGSSESTVSISFLQSCKHHIHMSILHSVALERLNLASMRLIAVRALMREGVLFHRNSSSM
jgi:hypothetical protein